MGSARARMFGVPRLRGVGRMRHAGRLKAELQTYARYQLTVMHDCEHDYDYEQEHPPSVAAATYGVARLAFRLRATTARQALARRKK